MTRSSQRRRIQSLIENGHLPKALKLCRQYCELAPHDAAGWHMLGLVQTRSGNHAAAEQSLQRAIQLQPASTQILLQLADIQQQQAKTEAALTTYRQVLQFDPANTDVLFALGLLHSRNHQPDQAASCFQQIIARSPQHFGAHASLGNLLFSKGDMGKAEYHFRMAAALQPDNALIQCNLGMALGAMGRHDEAVNCYQTALAAEPNLAEVHLLIAKALTGQGEFEAALAAYRKAAELKPELVDALAGEAASLEKLGQYDQAHDSIKRLIGSDRISTSVAIAYAAISRHFHEQEAACQIMENILKTDNLSTMQQLELHFASGRLLDELKEYDAAFNHFEQGNRLAPRHYSPEADARLFAAIRAVFPPQDMALFPHARNHHKKPLFIVGMPRSGTSLVEQIIASHPHVHGAGELRQLLAIARKLYLDEMTADGGKTFSGFSSNELDEYAEQHHAFLSAMNPSAVRVTDKMPHNFLHIGLIALLFPDAGIIHCTRHPMDTCLSIYFQYFGGSNSYAYQLESIGQHYCHYVRLMQHWKALQIPVLDVSYEELVADPETVSRRILAHCELDWDDRCLDFHKSAYLTRTASYDQVRQPVHTRALERWRHYQRQLAPLVKLFRTEGIL